MIVVSGSHFFTGAEPKSLMSRVTIKDIAMKISVLLLIFTWAFTCDVFTQCASQTNIYTFTYARKNYEVVKEMKNWSTAAACAFERGGYLVEINDVNEQNAVYDAIINGAGVSPTYTSVPNGGGIAYVWIGATDQANEGTWLWDGNNDGSGLHFWTGQGANGSGNGTPVGGAYNNWGGTSTGLPKEPDNYGAGQDHAAIGLAGWPSGTTLLGIAGEWNDIIGSSLLYFVVEKETGVGVNKGNPSNEIRVYPNPAGDVLLVEGILPSVTLSYAIYDNYGKIMADQVGCNNPEIRLETLPQGLYVIRITNDFTSSFKFIKR